MGMERSLADATQRLLEVGGSYRGAGAMMMRKVKGRKKPLVWSRSGEVEHELQVR